jgi:hypothetical protein
MSSKQEQSSPLKLFVAQIYTFSKELCDMYPEDLDIRMAKNAIKAVKNIHPKVIYETFNEHIYPYRDQILNREESFFLDMDYSQFKAKPTDLDVPLVMNLKKYWTSLSEETKNNMWLYFAVLIKLCEKVGQK